MEAKWLSDLQDIKSRPIPGHLFPGPTLWQFVCIADCRCFSSTQFEVSLQKLADLLPRNFYCLQEYVRAEIKMQSGTCLASETLCHLPSESVWGNWSHSVEEVALFQVAFVCLSVCPFRFRFKDLGNWKTIKHRTPLLFCMDPEDVL